MPHYFLPFAFKTNCLILTAVKNALIFLGHPPTTGSVANILSFDSLVRKSVYDILWTFWKNIRIGQCSHPTFHATIWWTSTYLSDCLAEKSTQIKRTAFLNTAASFYADRATWPVCLSIAVDITSHAMLAIVITSFRDVLCFNAAWLVKENNGIVWTSWKTNCSKLLLV